MKIYTKKGDKGTTSLVYGERVRKNHPQVEAYGTVDEINSLIGVALTHIHNTPDKKFLGKKGIQLAIALGEVTDSLRNNQTTLFKVGAELSTPSNKEVKWKLSEKEISDLEETIDKWEEVLPTLTQFILPGGTIAAAQLQVARTVTRRAERVVVELENVNPLVLAYLNRFSDYLFVTARYLNHLFQVEDNVLRVEEER